VKRWKLALSVAVLLVITIGALVLRERLTPLAQGVAVSSPSQSAAPSTTGSSSVGPSAVPSIPGVLQPEGKPEFAATFTGSRLDSSIFDTCYPWVTGSGCTNFGNAFETEWYLPSQVQVRDGLLHLVAQGEPTEGTTKTGAPAQYACRSGMVTTYPGFSFEYGYVQVVASIPGSPGLFPAIWLAPSDLKWPPEMDMVESWGDGVEAASFFHPVPSGYVKGAITPATLALGWHVFGLSWTPSQLTFLMDGKPTLIINSDIPQQPMYLIANLADYLPVDGSNQCSGTMLIKSIDVWKA